MIELIGHGEKLRIVPAFHVGGLRISDDVNAHHYDVKLQASLAAVRRAASSTSSKLESEATRASL